MRLLLKFAAWGCLTFIIYATLSPISQRPQIHTGTSYLDMLRNYDHYLAFLALGVLFAAAYPKHLAWVCIIVFGGAIVLEFSQYLTPDRHGRAADAIQKCIGGAAGIALLQLAVFVRQRWIQKA